MNAIHFAITTCGIFYIALSVQGQTSLPIRLPELKSSKCPAKVPANFTDSDNVGSVVDKLLTQKYGAPFCTCGKGVFQRAIYLDMSNSSMQCPSNWRLQEGAVRGCGFTSNTGGCSSAVFATTKPYNHVCGRIIGYQKGSTDAFDTTIGTLDLEQQYVEGVSLTYGARGSRKHIWTFASSLYYSDPNFRTTWNCECTNTNYNWNHPLPSFVGNNYFCESGNPGPNYDHSIVYADDPLWDGQGCPSTSSCCGLNRPPWFCSSLSQTTTEDLEIRICRDQDSSNENIIISLVDIYTSKL